ncbi:MAG: ROK family transcriptional regulator [Thalassovita sp.]
MSNHERSSHSDELRESGRQQILDSIRAAGSIARIDISRETGISPATVTTITSELLTAGLIEEIIPENRPAGAGRGRPRVALGLRGDAHRIAGVKVAHHTISVLLIDFKGVELADHQMPLPVSRLSPHDLCTQIFKAVEQACAKAGFGLAEISGIGVGMAGLVDAPRNFVYWSPSLTDRNVDFGAHLGQVFHCPVIVDNDANLVAKAEHLFGEGRKISDFIVITVEHGVGMGVVIDNEIYRGTRGCGAEFGHTKVQLAGALCQCGQRGCLEAYVGDYALLREANLLGQNSNISDVNQMYLAAQNGDQIAASIFDRAGRMFAMGLANIINIFDPELIVLAGASKGLEYLLTEAVIEEMRRSVVQVDAPLPEVKIHAWGDQMWAKGAAAYAVEKVTSLTVKELAQHAG